MAYRKSRAKYETIVEMYTVAMVELKLCGAGEHTVNQYRTLNPKKMRDFLPYMREHITAVDKHGELALIPAPPTTGRNRIINDNMHAVRKMSEFAMAYGGTTTYTRGSSEEVWPQEAAVEETGVRGKTRAGVYHGRRDVAARWMQQRR